MITKVTVPLAGIVDAVVAASAIAAAGSADERPALLTHDHDAALLMSARSACRLVAVQLAPYLNSADCTDEVLVLDFLPELAINVQAAGALVGDIVVAHVLHRAHAASYPKVAAAWAQTIQTALAALHAAILAAAPAPGRIKPHP